MCIAFEGKDDLGGHTLKCDALGLEGGGFGCDLGFGCESGGLLVERFGRFWLVERVGILRCAQNDGRNRQRQRQRF